MGVFLVGIPLLILLAPSTWYLMLFMVYYAAAVMIMTAVTYIAMRSIHKNSAGLEKVGIKKDRDIMHFYIGCWVFCAIVSLIIVFTNGSMILVAHKTYYGAPPTTRLAITNAVFAMLEFICLVLLDLVILWHYWKAGSKKQTDAAKILTNVHRKARARIID